MVKGFRGEIIIGKAVLVVIIVASSHCLDKLVVGLPSAHQLIELDGIAR